MKIKDKDRKEMTMTEKQYTIHATQYDVDIDMTQNKYTQNYHLYLQLCTYSIFTACTYPQKQKGRKSLSWVTVSNTNRSVEYLKKTKATNKTHAEKDIIKSNCVYEAVN